MKPKPIRSHDATASRDDAGSTPYGCHLIPFFASIPNAHAWAFAEELLLRMVPETSTVSCKARADRDELRGLAADIKAIVAESNTSHNKLAAEVRAPGMMNRALEESR